MKVWLDDLRKAPFGHEVAKTAAEAIVFLQTRTVEFLSLDHDLCEAHYGEIPTDVPTGYAVIEWMIEQRVWPHTIHVHSLSPSGAAKMMRALYTWAPAGCIIRRVKPDEV